MNKTQRKISHGLEMLHHSTERNQAMLELAGSGTCIYCAKTTDTDKLKFSRGTAICPHCSVDSIIPNLTASVLQALHNEYFVFNR